MAYKVTECLGFIKELFFPTEPEYKELTFTQEAYAKLMCYINLIGGYEITGFGRVVDNKVVDIKILEQEVKTATVDCDVDAMMEFLTNIPREEMGQWILDWHSHVDMGVFASGTDTSNYKEQFKARNYHQFPYLIVNKKQDVYCRCYISPSREEEIKVYVEQEGLTQVRLSEIYSECKENIEKLCTKYEPKKTTYTTRGYGYYGSYYGEDSDDDNWNTYYGNNNKKKDSTISTEKADTEADRQVITSTDYEDFCWGCGEYLVGAEEWDRHLCDDCWEKMSMVDKQQWMQGVINENIK